MQITGASHLTPHWPTKTHISAHLHKFQVNFGCVLNLQKSFQREYTEIETHHRECLHNNLPTKIFLDPVFAVWQK